MTAGVLKVTTVWVTVLEVTVSAPDVGPSVYAAAAVLLITVPAGRDALAGDGNPPTASSNVAASRYRE
jgi:hypothetical protein